MLRHKRGQPLPKMKRHGCRIAIPDNARQQAKRGRICQPQLLQFRRRGQHNAPHIRTARQLLQRMQRGQPARTLQQLLRRRRAQCAQHYNHINRFGHFLNINRDFIWVQLRSQMKSNSRLTPVQARSIRSRRPCAGTPRLRGWYQHAETQKRYAPAAAFDRLLHTRSLARS